VSPQKALQLAELALDRRISEGIPAPTYTREILDVIKVLIATPQIAARVPVILDFYLFGDRGGILQNDPLYDRSLSLSRRVLSALSYASGVSNSLWNYQTGQRDLSEVERQARAGPTIERNHSPGVETKPADVEDKNASESPNPDGTVIVGSNQDLKSSVDNKLDKTTNA
jgi:hypothetical protein